MADPRPKRPLVTLREGAAVITEEKFPVSARTLERWPIVIQLVNGKRMTPLADLLRIAQGQIDAAPAIKRDGRRSKAKLKII